MLRNHLKLFLLLLATAFLVLHATCLETPRSADAPAATYPFLLLAPILALTGCLWQARRGDLRASVSWTLVSVGLILWICGMSLSGWEELTQHAAFTVPHLSDFLFFLYGVPILLAISTPGAKEGNTLNRWMDGAQAALTTYLIYVAILECPA
jgi:hypothetical protein